MTNTIDTSTLSQLGLSRQSTDSTAKELGQDDFLRLMITQLRNQDPFSPMESGDFLGQLAQFGTVSGIDEVRSALDVLSGAMTANHAMQAASLVGRDVLVPGREAWLPPEGSVSGAVEVPEDTSNVTMGVYDLGGSLVATVPVNGESGTSVPYEWDGKLDNGDDAPSGYYELRAMGTSAGETVSLEVLVSGRVESVSVNSGVVSVTATGLGVVNFADVRGIA